MATLAVPQQPQNNPISNLGQSFLNYLGRGVPPDIRAIANILWQSRGMYPNVPGITELGGLAALGTNISKAMLEQARYYVPGGTEIGWAPRVTPAMERKAAKAVVPKTVLYKPIYRDPTKGGNAIPMMSRAIESHPDPGIRQAFRNHWWTSDPKLADRIANEGTAPFSAIRSVAQVEMPKAQADWYKINFLEKDLPNSKNLLHNDPDKEYIVHSGDFNHTLRMYPPEKMPPKVDPAKAVYGPPTKVAISTRPPTAKNFIENHPYGRPGIYHAFRGATPEHILGGKSTAGEGAPGSMQGKGAYITMDPRYADVYARGPYAEAGEILHHVIAPVAKPINLDDPTMRRWYWQQALQYGDDRERQLARELLRIREYRPIGGAVRRASQATLQQALDPENNRLPQFVSPQLIDHLRKLGYDAIYSSREMEGEYPSMVHIKPEQMITDPWKGAAPWEEEVAGRELETHPGGEPKVPGGPQREKTVKDIMQEKQMLPEGTYIMSPAQTEHLTSLHPGESPASAINKWMYALNVNNPQELLDWAETKGAKELPKTSKFIKTFFGENPNALNPPMGKGLTPQFIVTPQTKSLAKKIGLNTSKEIVEYMNKVEQVYGGGKDEVLDALGKFSTAAFKFAQQYYDDQEEGAPF